MLSMKMRRSRPCSSRKYSAMVRPVSATRRRAPGGSFIWPKTIDILSMTPDSLISPRSCPLTRALADAAEDGKATVLGGDVSNQLLDDDGLSGAGPTEHRRLATLEEGADEVDHLHPGLEDLSLSRLFRERRRIAMDRIAPHALHRPFAVDRLAHDVEEPSERLLADRDRDRSAYRDRFHSPAETIRR